MSACKGKLYVVGVGPGNHDHMTYRTKTVIKESQIIVGYDTYVSLVEDLIKGKEVYRYAMTQEVERANQAIEFAEDGMIVTTDQEHFPLYRLQRSFLLTRLPECRSPYHDLCVEFQLLRHCQENPPVADQRPISELFQKFFSA